METVAQTNQNHDVYPFRILIVDDDPTQRMLEREILVPPKYQLVEAATGLEALAALKGMEFDVVLLDKRMPGMDGDEVCRRIRHDLGHAMLPIIMVTGTNSAEELAASMACGASDFIRKPYHPLELVARVDAAVQHKRMTDQLDSAESMLFALARMVEAKDTHTGDHCTRLAHTGVAFGQALGLGAEELLALRRGGVLHDIGKLGIPESILLKPGKLTEEEWVVMRQHTVIGAHLCSALKSMRLTVPIILSHHERWDGSGYPHRLKGREIPLLARVFQIVDIYDALSHARPYKAPLPQDEVVRILKEEVDRGWRDPELMQVFLDLVQHRPDELVPAESGKEDLGVGIYREISATGALGWDAAQRALQGTSGRG